MGLNIAKPSLRRLAPGLVVAVGLLGAVLIAADWSEIQGALEQASWEPIPYALAATGVSYFCISYSFARVCQLLGIRMRLKDLTAVGFVTTVLNHLVTSGGAAGYSVRWMVMGRHGASSREVITTSILHFYLTSLGMMAMLPVGLVYFLLHATISRTVAAVLTLFTCVVLLGSILFTGLVFRDSLRRKVSRVLVRAASALIRRDPVPQIERFDTTMTQAVQAIREQPVSIIVIMGVIMTDWVCSAVALWFCFDALGVRLFPGQLISGFVIGTVAGVASMVPGGLGVQEGSMAGLFSLLGVSLERALLGAILFRVVYFMVPYAISLAFYWPLLRSGEIAQTVAGREVEFADPDVEPRIPADD